MADKKKEKKVESDPNTAYAIRKLGKLVRTILDVLAESAFGKEYIRKIEKRAGVDLDGDGKIGSIRMAFISILLIGAISGFAFAALQSGSQRPEDNSLYTWQIDSEGIQTITANEATDAEIVMEADQGDDDVDTWKIYVDADDSSTIKFATYSSGAYADVFELTTSGALSTTSLDAGTTNYSGGITADVEITLTDTTGSAVITATGADGAFDASIVLDSSAGNTAGNKWTVTSQESGQDLSVLNETNERLNLTKLGALSVDASITAGDDLISTDDLTVGGLATVAETLAVVGVATFTEESVHNLGIDADSITVDEDGAGIDTKAAGTLTVGAATADKVEISVTAVETEIQGTLDVLEASGFIGVATFTAKDIHNGGIDINEDVDIDCDAADEEVAIDQAAVAHTEATSFVTITDAATGATATENDEATLEVNSKGVYGISITDGALYVEGISTLDGAITGGSTLDVDSITIDANKGLDTQAAGTLLLGAATADRVELGDTAIVVETEGPLHATEFVLSDEVDALSATTLLIGKATASRVELGDTAIVTETEGPLHATEFVLSDELDSLTVAALTIGKATCNAVTIGASDITTAVAGPFRMTSTANTLDASVALTLTSAHYGQLVTFTNQAAVAVILPANGAPAGTWIEIAQGTVQNNTTAITVSAAIADTLIGPNDIDLDSVTYAAGHRIGGYMRFVSDGGFWQVLNLGGTTMTYTD